MEEGGSSNYSKVKAYISVSNNHPTRYYCGDTVSGLVVIDAETVFTTRAICVVLVGMEFAQQHKTFQRRNFYTQRLILFGEDWPKRNNGAVIQLPPGKHTFPFTFQLPPARPAPGEKRVVLPPTGGGLIWYDRRHNNRSVVAVSYIIRSFVDLNHSPALRVLHSIEPSLFSPDTIVTPLWSIPMRGHTETYEFIKNGLRTGISHEESKTFLAASGSLSCKVILDRNVTFTYDDDRHGLPADLQAQIHAGEPFCRPLKALVTVVNNSSLPVEAISISLAQEGLVSITGNPHCGDTWQNDSYLYPHAKVDIPAVKTGGPAVAYEHLFTMKVPDNLTPHIETFYSKLRWFVKVEVHVGSALALNLIVKVPIHIVSLGPEPLLREILSEPFEPIVLPGSFAPTQTILVPTRAKKKQLKRLLIENLTIVLYFLERSRHIRRGARNFRCSPKRRTNLYLLRSIKHSHSFDKCDSNSCGDSSTNKSRQCSCDSRVGSFESNSNRTTLSKGVEMDAGQ
eukprot:TRINITY_DN1009_c0_g1_i1.p1 TRINITY_DN1009_c0_g1~~TRINITY_DN1009_c0_g1_i1.p1  ORF type:complete len:577 (-),score=59.11 TRINITY_DN1009_c0_g1_i1:303-1832(-)